MQCLNKVHLQDQRQRNNKQQGNKEEGWRRLTRKLHITNLKIVG